MKHYTVLLSHKYVFALIVCIHNIEEFVQYSTFLEQGNVSKIYKIYLDYFHFDNVVTVFKISVVIITLTIILFEILYAQTKTHILMKIHAFLIVTMGINAIQHIAFSLYIQAYAPGLVSALLIVLPFTIHFITLIRKFFLFSTKNSVSLYP